MRNPHTDAENMQHGGRFSGSKRQQWEPRHMVKLRDIDMRAGQIEFSPLSIRSPGLRAGDLRSSSLQGDCTATQAPHALPQIAPQQLPRYIRAPKPRTCMFELTTTTIAIAIAISMHRLSCAERNLVGMCVHFTRQHPTHALRPKNNDELESQVRCAAGLSLCSPVAAVPFLSFSHRKQRSIVRAGNANRALHYNIAQNRRASRVDICDSIRTDHRVRRLARCSNGGHQPEVDRHVNCKLLKNKIWRMLLKLVLKDLLRICPV
jgi:hypothetical protein